MSGNDFSSGGVREDEINEKFIHAAGPGGQNVNKVATAVQLRFDITNSTSISAYVKNRLRQIAKHLISNDGVLTIEASRYRTQARNRDDARIRLATLIEQASRPPPKKRKATKPTRGSIERRLKAKSGRGAIKKMRGRVRDE